MKKQFNRMRQLANQTVEKRLELVKQVSHSTHKKLTACLQGQQGLDADKRSKKLPLTTLAQCLMEGSAVLGDDSLLGHSFSGKSLCQRLSTLTGKSFCLRAHLNLLSGRLKPFPLSCPYRPLSKAPLQASCSPFRHWSCSKVSPSGAFSSPG
uniref:BAR domain-containing protein n=1 Tax=Strigops habroptila TaxID=2489341 RepID=A0A672V232_STRHB